MKRRKKNIWPQFLFTVHKEKKKVEWQVSVFPLRPTTSEVTTLIYVVGSSARKWEAPKQPSSIFSLSTLILFEQTRGCSKRNSTTIWERRNMTKRFLLKDKNGCCVIVYMEIKLDLWFFLFVFLAEWNMYLREVTSKLLLDFLNKE